MHPHSNAALSHNSTLAFDWSYGCADATLAKLYARAVSSQWIAAQDLPWQLDVDPERPGARIVPDSFFDFDGARTLGVDLTARERARFLHDMGRWMLSQFLHGEQGALYAASQIVAGAESFDVKNMAATQTMDEARHVEVFARYLREKLDGIYPIDDNLYSAIVSLVSEPQWDVKVLGTQLVLEGLAITAFGSLFRRTEEPLLKALLGRVLDDEARHVQFGVSALRELVPTLDARAQREREDWAYDITRQLRDRFYAYELYDHWFSSHLTRKQWRELMDSAPGSREQRRVMYGRVLRQLEHVGLRTDRIRAELVELRLAP